MNMAPLTVVATAAVREAVDGQEFSDEVLRETGLRLWVIGGDEEARLSAQGVLLGWPDAKGIVCDIGGSSMELAQVGGGKVGARATSPLGPFRLQQVQGGPKARRQHIHGILAEMKKKFPDKHPRIYLVGGSWRVIARLDMERRAYPLTVLHEYRMLPQQILETLDWISVSDLPILRVLTGTSQERMELVPLASEVLRGLVEVFEPREVDVSAYGIREGLLFEQMPEVDILINNAGAIPGGSVVDVDEQRWRQAWELKVFGYINMTRMYLPMMQSRGHGVICNIIGMAGAAPRADYICGATGNAALIAFTQGVGGESVKNGVRVFGINPSPTRSDRMQGMLQQQAEKKFGV
jgi:exopolyphosphatase/pppGpp-phosphohydrolase